MNEVKEKVRMQKRSSSKNVKTRINQWFYLLCKSKFSRLLEMKSKKDFIHLSKPYWKRDFPGSALSFIARMLENME